MDGEMRTPSRQNTVKGNRRQLPECACLFTERDCRVWEEALHGESVKESTKIQFPKI
jgi:hypothetical protein